MAAEVLLFVLVGATVDLNYAFQAGLYSIIIVLGALLLRMIGVYVCLLKTKLSSKERLFCMLAYTPKATVQVAVLSILITAPFGAICIDNLYPKFLDHT